MNTGEGESGPNSQPTCPYAIGYCGAGYPLFEKSISNVKSYDLETQTKLYQECESWRKAEVQKYATCLQGLNTKAAACDQAPASWGKPYSCRTKWTHNSLEVVCKVSCEPENAEDYSKSISTCTAKSSGYWLTIGDCVIAEYSAGEIK